MKYFNDDGSLKEGVKLRDANGKIKTDVDLEILLNLETVPGSSFMAYYYWSRLAIKEERRTQEMKKFEKLRTKMREIGL